MTHNCPLPAVQDASISNPYPSRILVSGRTGVITKVTLTLSGLTTSAPDDLDFLLVGPGGQTFIFMSDVGGANTISNVNVTLDDAAASQLPDTLAFGNGTYRPASYLGGGDGFAAVTTLVKYRFRD